MDPKFFPIWASQVLQEKCLMNYLVSYTKTIKETGSYNADCCFFTHMALEFLNLNSKIQFSYKTLATKPDLTW